MWLSQVRTGYNGLLCYMVNKMDIVKENSNRSYPSMVAHHQTILDYSINNQKIIHLFEIDTYCFFLIYWSDYFYWVIDLWKWLFEVLYQYGQERESNWYDVFRKSIKKCYFYWLCYLYYCPMSRRFFTFFDYAYKDLRQIDEQQCQQW